MTRGARKDSFGAYLAPVVIKKCRVSPHSEKRHEAQPTRRTGDDAERDAHARCTPCFEAPDLITSSTRKRTDKTAFNKNAVDAVPARDLNATAFEHLPKTEAQAVDSQGEVESSARLAVCSPPYAKGLGAAEQGESRGRQQPRKRAAEAEVEAAQTAHRLREVEAAEEARAVLEAEARRLARENVDNVDQSGCLELEEEEEEEEDEFDPYLFIKKLPPLEQCVQFPRTILLPPKTRRAPRITLVLDLDETLVHSSLEEYCSTSPTSDHNAAEIDFTFPVHFNNQEHKVNVRRRPGLDAFMQEVAKKFEVIVFTASQRVYAEQLLNILDPQRCLIRHRVFRDSCVCVDGNYLKDLTVLGRDMRHTVIVDNSPQAFGFQVRWQTNPILRMSRRHNQLCCYPYIWTVVFNLMR